MVSGLKSGDIPLCRIMARRLRLQLDRRVSSSSSIGTLRFLAKTQQLRIGNHLLASFISNQVTKNETETFLGFIVIHVLDDATQNIVHSTRKEILILKLDTGTDTAAPSHAEIRIHVVGSSILALLRSQENPQIRFETRVV
jgi:hypothetical protein